MTREEWLDKLGKVLFDKMVENSNLSVPSERFYLLFQSFIPVVTNLFVKNKVDTYTLMPFLQETVNTLQAGLTKEELESAGLLSETRTFDKEEQKE